MVSYIYLASPYTHSDEKVMEDRYNAVVDAVAFLTNGKYHVYSPILHFHPVAVKHSLPRDAEFWRESNEIMLYPAGLMYVLAIPGWDESKGVRHEIMIARQLETSIRLMNPDETFQYLFEPLTFDKYPV